METTKYREVWELDSLFPGGSESSQLLKHIKELEGKVYTFANHVSYFQPSQEVADSIKIAALLEHMSTIQIHVSQANSFITCLLAQNSKDQTATSLQSKIGDIRASFDSSVQKTQKILQGIEENLWQSMLDTSLLQNHAFILNELRTKGARQLNDNEFVSELMIDGYHAWGQFYHALISDIKVNISINGNRNELSVGQAINLRSHPDEKVRRKSHEVLENTWIEKEDLFARILNHIVGFRQQVYKKRGIENVLEEPLIDNRIEEDTLNAMWRAVNKQKKPFVDYLNKKAELLGEPKLNAYNFWAPITESTQQLEYKEAVDFITKHCGQFGPELEAFTLNAFEQGWVESENRSAKSVAAFCAGFPLTGESRVFMTFGGTIKDVLALAHELGHAFHNYAMKSVDGLSKKYPLSLAETASTFSEMIVLEAAIKETTSDQEKLFLVDEKLKRSVMNFMNMHSRFLFEKNLNEERKQGFVSPSRLNALMKEAMEEAYHSSLENASVHSWIWTPHYYITKSPFYNFPYTFGYLFALSIFAKAKEKWKTFEQEYLALLRDSGRMSTEDLVMKHLEEDIKSEVFWEKGLALCIEDVREFIRLTEKIKR